MTVCNFDWSKFDTNTNWARELDKNNSRIEEVCQEIIKTLGGYQKIKVFRASIVGDDISVDDCFYEEDVTLLKKSTMLNFRKRNITEDCELSKTYIKDINNICFNKIYEDDFYQYYTILLNEKEWLLWKFDIVI